jgi:UMF1 family MFS transporter
MAFGSPISASAPSEAEQNRREQRAWYYYDWANSGYVTTVATVLFAPYLTAVAETAACGVAGTSTDPCRTSLRLLGLDVSPGSLVFYIVTLATIVSAFVLPIVGAIADRSSRKKTIMAGFAWTGSAFAAAMFLVTGSDWVLGAVLLFGANICLGASVVVYDAILCEIATPDERNAVSSRGWAMGYLGGGLLLTVNLAVVSFHDALGLSEGMAVRICLLSAAAWWAGFTVIPYLRIRNRPVVLQVESSGGLFRRSFGQLAATLKDLRSFPTTLRFLLAYLFFNDGIQTVIAVSSTYGEKELGFTKEVLIATILIVQFVAFGGALLFGRIAAVRGSKATIAGGLVVWMAVVVTAFVLPSDRIAPFLVLAVVIGIVLGGTQALSRSLFSQLIPRGREAEYFSLYQACERGTSWLGTLTFGLVHQLSGSYRPAIISLIVLFVVGLAILVWVDPQRGIAEAGNPAPTTV